MPDYRKGKIYKIVSDKTDKMYYGSTCSPLSVRMGNHRRSYKSWKKGKARHVRAYDIMEFGDARIVLVENYPCNNIEELEKGREAHYIRNEECVNIRVPGRTPKQYQEDNKEKYKQYYIDNREKKMNYLAEYRKKNSEKIKNSCKKWRDKNKEEIRQKSKKYRENNREKLIQYDKEKYKLRRWKKKFPLYNIDPYLFT